MTQFQGSTIQKAIAVGLNQLQVEREQVSVDVISEGRSGFLGFGKKPAIVDIKPISSIKNLVAETESQTQQIESIKQYLDQILTAMHLEHQILEAQASDSLVFDVQIAESYQSRLIGHHGKNVNALQTLIQEYAYRLGYREQPVMIDSGGYRQRRKTALIALSNFKSQQVAATHKPVYLDPMPAIERKIVYQNLADNPEVAVRTRGQGLQKHLIIRPVGHH